MTSYPSRPMTMGRRGVVTAGHGLAAEAGLRIMHQGGNAIDAAAATCLCLNVLEPHQNGLGGEVPVLVYSAAEKRTWAISGQGWSPKAFTIDWCCANGIDLIPHDGYLPGCVPAMVGTWTTALARFGTMSLAQVAQPAIELAEGGFALYPTLHQHLVTHAGQYIDRFPTTAAVYLPDGRVPPVGSLIRVPDFAATLRRLCQAEAEAAGRGRTAGLEAATDAFYRGPIADQILDYITNHPIEDASGSAHTGLLTADDFAQWHAAVEEPITYRYRGLDVHKCSSWTQGPVFLQQLAILHAFDLHGMGHNTMEYLHTWIESAKLAFADREAYYGDPEFDDVPIDVLLSDRYNAQRRGLIDSIASSDLRPGDVGGGVPDYILGDVRADNRRALGMADHAAAVAGASRAGDTTQLAAIDAEGNMVSATPSGGWITTSPVIPGLGMCLGTRGQMFYLNPQRPNALAGRKRPRSTLTPSLVTRDGRPLMAFGTPGGDLQDQLTLQFFINVTDFGMDLQEAIDAPTVYSQHFPWSFYPRDAFCRQATVEGRIDHQVISDLEQRGHKIVVNDDWAHGRVQAIRIDHRTSFIHGAVSPRGSIARAMAW